jgi:hypothetical protein
MRDTGASPGSRGVPWSPILGGLGLLVVVYGGLSKALLVHSLQYDGSDFYSFLEMTWSWLYAGLLHDNVYGFHGAIHNFYLLPLLAPLTVALGAYGLVVALVLAHGAGVVGVASHPDLDDPARLAILAGALGPFAFFVVDNPRWGFHPEVLYPPLALLLALALLRGWTWRAVALAGLVVLVKEDGALVCLSVVLAHTAWRWGVARQVSPEEARRALRTGLRGLLVFAVVFLAGMALLSWWSHRYAETQTTSADRLGPAVRAAVRTLSGQGRPRLDRLLEALPVYLLMSVLMLVPLGRRLPRGLLLFGAGVPCLLAVVVVSAAPYRFNMMLWAPRVATLQAAVVAALVFAAVTPPGRRPARLGAVALLAVASWVGQGAVLHGMGYSLAARVVGPGARFGPPPSHLEPAEDRYLRCVASHLPWALPVSGKGKTYLVFHRQSVVFGSSAHNWHPARLRVVRAAAATGELGPGVCRAPTVGSFAIEAECDLLPLFADCPSGP